MPGGEGLSYYGARWYDAQLGRFASPDTVVSDPVNPQTFNRYSYVTNNPTGLVDPTGHYDVAPGDDPWWNNTKPASSGRATSTWGGWWTPVSDFFYGGLSQWGYNNSWVAPAYQTRFAEQPYESTATTVGRHTANLVSMVQGGIELIGGGGLGAAGATACGTGVLCLAGAPAIAGGAALVTHGGTVVGVGAVEEGRMLSNVVMAWFGSGKTSSSVSWTPHGYKHFPPKKTSWKDIIRSTESGPAKYSPGTDVEALERSVWENGLDVTNGRPWKVQDFGYTIGASEGEESRWIRVEMSGNTIHGHPITEAEFLRLTR